MNIANLERLPAASHYEVSYMHRETVSHILSAAKDFIVTVSIDGTVKFWKKNNVANLDFVKSFKAHLGPITSAVLSENGLWLATGSLDKTIKIFDIENFDMIEIIRLDSIPDLLLWVRLLSSSNPILLVQKKNITADNGIESSDTIPPIELLLFDPWKMKSEKSKSTPIQTFTAFIDSKSYVATLPLVTAWDYDKRTGIIVTGTEEGTILYLNVCEDADTTSYVMKQVDVPEPNHLCDLKSETDRTFTSGIKFNNEGSLFATMGTDRFVRVFRLSTGKLVKKFDERLAWYSEMQQQDKLPIKLDDLEFGRRLAIERELQKTPYFASIAPTFDQTGQFLLYPSIIGVKVIHLESNKVVRILGKGESLRPLQLALYQNIPAKKRKGPVSSLELAAAENAILDVSESNYDPCLFFTSFKKSRFYIISKREPDSDSGSGAFIDRDVLNEAITASSTASRTEASTSRRNSQLKVILRTSKGDITLQLTPKETPRTVQNFVTHCKNGYYNNVLFHRVINNFMIQTGDPLGDGTGGESIWGGEFEDEFHPDLKHSQPFVLSMANCGPNTNGSQFFITTVKCPWLDNKHTIFGRVIDGSEVVTTIENVKCDNLDRPLEPIKILQVDVIDI